MERASVRKLHLNTSELIKDVVERQTYIMDSRGKPLAELRPISEVSRRGRPLPDREAWIRKLPFSKTDSGRILEEIRT